MTQRKTYRPAELPIGAHIHYQGPNRMETGTVRSVERTPDGYIVRVNRDGRAYSVDFRPNQRIRLVTDEQPTAEEAAQAARVAALAARFTNH